jgi:hypothetical protein
MKGRRLLLRHEAVIHPLQPFHFTGTVHKPSHFPAPMDRFKGGSLYFSIRQSRKVFGIQLTPGPNGNGVWLKVYAGGHVGANEAAAVTREVRHRFGMDLDLFGFREIAREDPVLAPVEERWRGMRPSCAFSLYELLCVTIVLQNARVSRSVAMLEALLRRFGTAVRFGGELLYVFWPSSKLASADEVQLRDLKVGYRAKVFSRVSRFFVAHDRFEEEMRASEESPPKAQRDLRVGPRRRYLLSRATPRLLRPRITMEQRIFPPIFHKKPARGFDNGRSTAAVGP